MSNPSTDRPLRHLYKYRALSGRGLEFVEASLLRGEHYFATATAFNDPFDCVPVLSLHATTEEIIAHFAMLLENDPDRERKLSHIIEAKTRHPEIWDRRREEMSQSIVAQLTRDVGVFSLSALPDHILMWSHYGDSHRGVCIRFEASHWNIFEAVQKVAYAEERPILNLVRDDGNETLTKALLTKSHHWAYEQEWRIVTPNRGTPGTGPGVHLFPPEWIDAVILGARISADDERMVRVMIKARKTPTTVLRARVDNQKFRVAIERVE